jgi:hypothetical protein
MPKTSDAKRRSLGSFGVADEKDLLRRAFRAWFATGGVDIPSNSSEVEGHGRHWYVVLRGGRGPSDQPLAVYRLKNDGILRRLRRLPPSVHA